MICRVKEAINMIALEDLFMFHELRNQGLSISEIARRSGRTRNTARKHLRRALEPTSVQ